MGILQCILTGQAIFLTGNSLGDYINLDTLFIVVMVLAVIMLIMLVTYFVSIKPNLNSAEKQQSGSSVDNVIAQITQNEEEELINDCELVAVITAAIYASMGEAAPTGGLVVRSIKRANTRKWMNA